MKLFTIVVLAFIAAVCFWVDAPAQLTDKDLVSALQNGGYVIYMRHPKTNPDQADTDPLNLDNVSAQRQLTDEGRKQAQTVGEAFGALKIYVDRVISSKFYRAYEAAQLLKMGEVTTSIDVSEGGLVVSPNENNRRTKVLQQLLSTPPAVGKNTVIVSHKPNLVDAAGKDFMDTVEGETIIFQPDGHGRFKFMGRVTVEKWLLWTKE